MLVATLDEFKEHINYGTGTSKDAEMTLHLTAASLWAQSYVVLEPTVFTERLWANGCHLQQRRHPLVSVTSVTPQDGTALPASSYIVDTTSSQIELRFDGFGWYIVVYTAGLSTIGAHVKLAGLEVARHLWEIQNGSGGRGHRSEDMVPTPFGFAVPARAIELIESNPDLDIMPGFA